MWHRVFFVGLLSTLLWAPLAAAQSKGPIKVGVLHSFTGTMAISERAVADASLLAIEQINEQGGLLGRPIETVVADGASDPETFAREAERLIEEEKVSVIFGCWTSASRKAVKPVIETKNHLLFYPVQYEGIEQSPNIIYTGAAPNQQVMPAVSYCMQHIGKRVFLVGSDYVFPRMANAIIKDQVKALRGEVVGEMYVPLGSPDVGPMIEQILKTKPDVILNSINGDTNVAFFHALQQAGIKADNIPTMSFSIGENELLRMDAKAMAGNYAAWNYFQSIETPENHQFLKDLRARYGPDRVASDPVETAYFSANLWAQAVRDAKSVAPTDVGQALRGQGRIAPGGLVYIDQDTQHTWKYARIGRMRPDGQFDIVWSSDKPVQPQPFPLFRTRREWIKMLDELNHQWNGHWAAPATKGAP